MKIHFCILPFILILVSNTLVGQTNKKTSSFIPLKTGNYWVYALSDDPNKLDTVKITETKIVNDTDTGYYYDGNLWVVKNDSVFQYQSHRGGTEFRTLQYFPSKSSKIYKVVVQGDILGQRKVSKLKKPYVVKGKKYTNCYRFTQVTPNADEVITISKGIGIIEIKNSTRTRSLVSYKIQ